MGVYPLCWSKDIISLIYSAEYILRVKRHDFAKTSFPGLKLSFRESKNIILLAGLIILILCGSTYFIWRLNFHFAGLNASFYGCSTSFAGLKYHFSLSNIRFLRLHASLSRLKSSFFECEDIFFFKTLFCAYIFSFLLNFVN